MWNESGLNISLDNLAGGAPKQDRGVPMAQLMVCVILKSLVNQFKQFVILLS